MNRLKSSQFNCICKKPFISYSLKGLHRPQQHLTLSPIKAKWKPGKGTQKEGYLLPCLGVEANLGAEEGLHGHQLIGLLLDKTQVGHDVVFIDARCGAQQVVYG